MKKALILPVLFLVVNVYGQNNYFKLESEEKLLSESLFNQRFKILVKQLPSDYTLTPIIFHKRKGQDSIINYIAFQKIWWGNLKIDSSKFNIVYKQDPLYLLVDNKLPEFKLKDINGNIFTSSSLIGKPTLIDFWDTHCRGCILEMPELNKLKDKYKEEINFVAISYDPLDTAVNFLKRKKFDFYHLVEGGNYARNILKISGIPVNIFIDRNGYVREIHKMMPADPDKPFPSLSNQLFDKLLEKLTKEL